MFQVILLFIVTKRAVNLFYRKPPYSSHYYNLYNNNRCTAKHIVIKCVHKHIILIVVHGSTNVETSTVVFASFDTGNGNGIASRTTRYWAGYLLAHLPSTAFHLARDASVEVLQDSGHQATERVRLRVARVEVVFHNCSGAEGGERFARASLGQKMRVTCIVQQRAYGGRGGEPYHTAPHAKAFVE